MNTFTKNATDLAEKAANAHDSGDAMRFSQAATHVTNAAATIAMIERDAGVSSLATTDRVKTMVDRFLQWKLPEDFSPDGGISFDPISNRGNQYEARREPVGTNLLTATQAEAMIRHLLA